MDNAAASFWLPPGESPRAGQDFPVWRTPEELAARIAANRRERIALEMIRSLLASTHAFLWNKPGELADKAVANADALIARLDEPTEAP